MSDFQPSTIAKGNLPLVTDVLRDATGAPMNLTGCAVNFAFQVGAVATVAAGVIVDAATGKVSYQFTSGQTNTVGDYVAQWQVSGGAASGIYPLPAEAGVPGAAAYTYNCFSVLEVVPLAVPTGVTLVRQMYEPVRAILGDFNSQFRKYEDLAIASVVRTCLVTGKVPGQALGADRLSIAPGILLPSDLALLMYHAALMFVRPNVAEYSYQTRAMKERFGRQDHFIFDLHNAIYELENGAMMSSFQNFFAWINSLAGIDIWSVMSDMKTNAPVATVTVGRAGVIVSTT